MKKVKKFKYDWRLIPDHINFVATYENDCVAWGYVNKPVRKEKSMIWHETGGEWRKRLKLPAYRGHWSQSLEKRPTKAQLVAWVLNGAVLV